MKSLLFCVTCIAALFFSSCFDMGERVDGSGNIKTETRRVGDAGKIRLSGDMNVDIKQGAMSVTVEADDNVLPFIITKVEDGWLEIRNRDDVNINTSNPAKVHVMIPNITDVTVGGSGNITFGQKFSSNSNVSFKIAGSGDITADINAPKINSDISGSGNLHISGETRDVEIHIAGSGNYNGPELKAENAEIHIAGSGDASLFADANLKASIAGSGTVKYKGNAVVDQHISGSGSVSKE